jgi:hypothetical protein
VNRLEPAP